MKYIYPIIFLLFFGSCTSRYILIEKSESLAKNKDSNPKIICIDSQFRIYDNDDNFKAEESTELDAFLKKELAYSAKQTKLNLEVLDLNSKSNAAYYETLLRLKRELIMANNYQDTPLNFTNRPSSNSIKKNKFIYPPLIDHSFNNLAAQFGTPYFSHIGIYKKDGKLILYQLVANVNTTETIYRELKVVSASKAKKGIMAQLIYDSIAMLKNEMK